MSFIPVLWTNVSWHQARCGEKVGKEMTDATKTKKGKEDALVNDISLAETTDVLADMDNKSCDSEDCRSAGEDETASTFCSEETGPMSPSLSAASIGTIMNELETNPGFQTTGMEEYTPVRRVQDAVRNCGSVELMQHIKSGSFVVVKRMPNNWVGDRPSDFTTMHAGSTEKPWMDIVVIRFLHQRQCPYICEPLGLFRDREFTYVMSAFADMGDLFSWCGDRARPQPGPDREAMIQPIAKQVVSGVQWLHQCGIAHRDISLENVVLTSTNEGLRAQLIDFGMASTDRLARCVCGKPSYQAPEMHTALSYDAFLADAFAVGATVICMATGDYPWLSTRPDTCSLFKYVSNHGLGLFIVRRKVRGTKERWADVLSTALIDMLLKLLHFDPEQRSGLLDNCSNLDGSSTMQSISNCEWLKC